MIASEALPVHLRRDLHQAGVAPGAVGALAFYPAIHVAWSDERLTGKEGRVVLEAVQRTGVAPAAKQQVARWLAARPDNAACLLDLTWRVVEQLAAPAQRLAAESAVDLASAVARATREGLLRSISGDERAAIKSAVEALGGGCPATARREALTWGQEIEDLLPGYAVVGYEELPTAVGLKDCSSQLDPLLPDLERLRRRVRTTLGIGSSQRRKLGTLLARAYRGLSADEQQLLGSDAPFEQLDAWSACRFVVLLVCRGATYDRPIAALARAAIAGDDEALEVLIDNRRDSRSTLEMVHELLQSTDVALVCRGYTRLVVQLFAACRHALGIGDVFLLPLFGRHDPRSSVGHAWCLYVDRTRRVATPLDPTGSDALWDSEAAASPFNWMLDGRALSNASTMLARLTEEPTAQAADAALEMVGSLPIEQRPKLAVRLLVQHLVKIDFTADELELIWQRATACGAPAMLADEELAAYHEEAARLGGLHDPDDSVLSMRRGRTIALLCASGVLAEGSLPKTLLSDLQHHRAKSTSDRAREADVGRNDPCPCGSGSKYKRCCGR